MNVVIRIKRSLSRYSKPKFTETRKINPTPLDILDIGIENDSYLECKEVYPNSRYTGLDFRKIDFEMIEGDKFILANLEDIDALAKITERYDTIIINHVLEHLNGGEYVFEKLLKSLKLNGIMYAEFPSIRSAYKKKVGKRYHFHEDSTHKKFYVLESLANLAMQNGCKVISCGPVSSPFAKSALSLPRALINFIQGNGFIRYLPSASKLNDHIFIQRSL